MFSYQRNSIYIYVYEVLFQMRVGNVSDLSPIFEKQGVSLLLTWNSVSLNDVTAAKPSSKTRDRFIISPNHLVSLIGESAAILV